ncbi:unnamed protein product [Spirodela intermedia]|uniref:SAM domain-containing protein n=1 Tax=Spirodela intermedia TaxID=51605 RepID=A0A7I8IQ34_SPIIN|nr:unnamed protein product [Spirodela intermedia]CAA6660018.1 unnamed protein product [Spirodela intermedia]
MADLLPEMETHVSGLGSKRQRRPSVRLGDIGEQRAATHESNVRRSKQWKSSSHHPLHPHQLHDQPSSGAAFRGGGRVLDESLHLGEENHLEMMMGIRKGGKDGKARRAGGSSARRVRTNWAGKVDEGIATLELKSGGEDAGDEACTYSDDLRCEDSESPIKEFLPSERPTAVVGISENRDVGAASTAQEQEMVVPLEMDAQRWNNGDALEEGSVRAWLGGLGLARYTPVFEVHEVDEEVLPLLTLEDLKDMGINAVGSRRKIYCAIQKFRKNSSKDHEG